MITPRALLCTSLFSALVLTGCGESGEPASNQSASADENLPSPFDVEPQGTLSREQTGAMPRVTPPPGGASAPIATDGTLRAGGVSFEIPEGWSARMPSSSMRAAELAIPSGEEGVEDGVLAVFASIGGTVEQNITRWIGQVRDPETPAVRDTRSVGALTVHTVVVTGTFDAGMMAGGTGPQPGTTLLGAVVEGGPGGPIFLKATGPKAVLASNLDGWRALIDSASAGG